MSRRIVRVPERLGCSLNGENLKKSRGLLQIDSEGCILSELDVGNMNGPRTNKST